MSDAGGDKPSPLPERDLIRAAMEQAAARSDAPQAREDLPPPETFPGYELIREIHRGGQGAVYQAIQKATKRRVAIKVMHGGPFQGSAGRARFEREVQILGQLNHPSIVGIHDSGVTAAGACYYVMDYISGKPLDELIAGSKAQPIDQTLRLFAKICDAVNAAHLRGVIHRDLKPANIRVNTAGEPVVVDFGLAKIAVPDVTDEPHPRLMTMTGQFIGSLPWASPEQAEGAPEKIDVRTDVYSLGVILYQLLTGRFPYDVIGNMRDVLDNILRAEPARPSTVRRQINDEVETIILKCLSKERERRYQSAGELGRDIQRYLSGEPIEAKRASGWYLISKTLRRHRVSAGVAAAFALLVLAAAVAMSLAYAAEARQRARADANFALVRGQARALMVDLNDSMSKLRGGTRARETLFLKARDYLQGLRAHAGNAADNPDFRRELADAADLLGVIRGGLDLPRLGDTASARELFAEARAIRERLTIDRPRDWLSHADLARSQWRTAQTLVTDLKYPEAIAEADRALASLDAAQALNVTPPAELTKLHDRRAEIQLVQADAWAALAEARTDPAQIQEAISTAEAIYTRLDAYWQERSASDHSTTAPARWLGVVADQRAALLTRRAAAATARATEALKKDPAAADARAAIEEAEAHLARSRELAQEAMDRFQQLSAREPQNAEWRRDTFIAAHNIGNAHMLAGDAWSALAKKTSDPEARQRAREHWTRAAAAFDQAQAITDELAAADPANVQARRDQVVVLNKSGNILREMGQLRQAEAAFRRSLDVRADLNRTDPTPRTKRDLAVGLYKMGEVLDLQGEESADPAAKRDAWRQAEQFFAQSFAEFDGLRDAGGTKADQARAASAQDALTTIRGKLGKLPAPSPAP